MWEVFILQGLARAIVGEKSSCNPNGYNMWYLGWGGHALMDMYTPQHRFQVWYGFGSASGVRHLWQEVQLQTSDPSVAMAIAGLSDFRQWFEQNRQLKPLGFYAVWGAMMANYGHLLQAEATYVLAQ